MKLILILGCFCSLFFSNVNGQKLSLVNVQELRSTNDGYDYCKLDFKPIGDEVRNYSHYKISEIKKATDNKGINLLPESMALDEYKPITESFGITLEKASRSASTVSVDGLVSFYKPTEANGGIVKIAGFRSKPEVNLAPKNAQFTLHYYDKLILSKKADISPDKRISDIEKMPEKDRDVANSVNELVNGLTYYSEEDLKNMLFFVVGGDYSSIMSMEFESSKGKKISPASSSITGNTYTFYFYEGIEPTMKVSLNIFNPKNAKIVPFVMTALDLP